VAQKIFIVLFVCTGNSVRSILPEGLMSELDRATAVRFGYLCIRPRAASQAPEDRPVANAKDRLDAVFRPRIGNRSFSRRSTER
jgi:hypothetical protein